MGQPVAPLYDLDGFRGRDNVPDPSGVDAAFDAGDTAFNTGWTQTTGQLIRFRMVVKQTVGTAVNHNNLVTEFILQYENATAGGGFLDVGAVGGGSEDVDFAAATGFADGDNTAQVIGSGTNVAGDSMETNAASDSITFSEETSGQECEIEVSVIVNAAQVTDGDVINFRLLFSDNNEAPPATQLNAETNAPTLTVDKPAASGRIMSSLVGAGGLAGEGGIAGIGGGIAG